MHYTGLNVSAFVTHRLLLTSLLITICSLIQLFMCCCCSVDFVNLGVCNINHTRLSFVMNDLYADSVARIYALCLITDVVYLIANGDFNCRCRSRFQDLFVEFSADLRLSSVDVV